MHEGRVIGGRYRALRRVARGGMSDIWICAQREAGAAPTLVAVKTVREGTPQSEDRLTMLLDEGRVGARLQHPNVCRTLDVIHERGEVFLVMEWLHGVSLAELLEAPGGAVRRPLSFSVGAHLVRGVALGLHCAHDAVDDAGVVLGVVHRDVTPENVFVCDSGRVCVTDFGVAQANGKRHATKFGQLKGTAGYLSPEQIVGDAVDRRTDVFALGMVLYEATTGFRPFHTKDGELPLVRRALAADYRKPQSVVPCYPTELSSIIDRTLQRDPTDRYASALELSASLDAYLLGDPAGDLDVAMAVRERSGAALDAAAREFDTLARTGAP